MALAKAVMAVIRASRPIFRNAHDKVAFAIHATFMYRGYLLTASGRRAFSANALSSTSTIEVGIENWNELRHDYAFVYFNPGRGSKRVFLKCLVMDEELLVSASTGDASEQAIRLEIKVANYVVENGGNNYAQQFWNLNRFIKILNEEIFSKLGVAGD